MAAHAVPTIRMQRMIHEIAWRLVACHGITPRAFERVEATT